MDLYQQNILDHYHHPKHKGKLPVADRHNEAANTLCGDKVELWIKIDNEKITTVGWDGEGCVLTQAACSLLCEKLINKSITEATTLDPQFMQQLVAVPLGPTRLRCALLPLEVLQKALKE